MIIKTDAEKPHAPLVSKSRYEVLKGSGNDMRDYVASKPKSRGGPTIFHPDRPYCKDDQSCCDFVCGN